MPGYILVDQTGLHTFVESPTIERGAGVARSVVARFESAKGIRDSEYVEASYFHETLGNDFYWVWNTLIDASEFERLNNSGIRQSIDSIPNDFLAGVLCLPIGD